MMDNKTRRCMRCNTRCNIHFTPIGELCENCIQEFVNWLEVTEPIVFDKVEHCEGESREEK